MLWMLSRCRPWRQHSDNTGIKHILLTKKLDMFATRSKLMNVVWMLSPETTFGQNKCFWPFSKAENTYFEPKKGEKHFFCPNVVSMLSPETTFRQHLHFVWKSWTCLHLAAKVVWMLSPDTTFRQHLQETFFLKILDMFATPAQSCLNVVSRDNIQTTIRQHNICKKKLLWTILDMFATRKVKNTYFVRMLSLETTFKTTFRQHLESIQITLARNIFWKILGMFATHSRCCLTVLCR